MALTFSVVVALNILEAASKVTGVGLNRNRCAGYSRGSGHRQSHHRRIDLGCVVVVNIRAVARPGNRQVGWMLVGPRGVSARRMDDAVNPCLRGESSHG